MTVKTLGLNSASTGERAAAAVGAAAATAAAVCLKLVNPSGAGYFPQCPFHALTGLNCPGCGLTRGMHALLNGDVAGAIDYNVLIVVLAPLFVYALATLILIAARGRGLPFFKVSGSGIWTITAVLLVFGLLRNLPFYPFTILAP